jgi:hypothetical protein
MVAEIFVGKSAPETIARLSHCELVSGSQVNAPIAILIWLMIYPMMLGFRSSFHRNTLARWVAESGVLDSDKRTSVVRKAIPTSLPAGNHCSVVGNLDTHFRVSGSKHS